MFLFVDDNERCNTCDRNELTVCAQYISYFVQKPGATEDVVLGMCSSAITCMLVVCHGVFSGLDWIKGRTAMTECVVFFGPIGACFELVSVLSYRWRVFALGNNSLDGEAFQIERQFNTYVLFVSSAPD